MIAVLRRVFKLCSIHPQSHTTSVSTARMKFLISVAVLALAGVFIAPAEAGVLKNEESLDVFQVNTQKREVVVPQTGCTDPVCQQICDALFPGRECVGKCISDVQCQCTCKRMDIFFSKPEKTEIVVAKESCTDPLCQEVCNALFPGRGCLGKCISDTQCQCKCAKLDVFFTKPETTEVVVPQTGCTDAVCQQICDALFPGRECVGKCISDVQCQCSCKKMDIFFNKPEKTEIVVAKESCTDPLCQKTCDSLFPGRGCVGKCISDRVCQCNCLKLDVFYVKP